MWNSWILRTITGLTPNPVVHLERAGVGTARAWLAMQSNFDLARELHSKEHNVRPLAVASAASPHGDGVATEWQHLY